MLTLLHAAIAARQAAPRRCGLPLTGRCSRWAPRVVALLIAVNLGLLSPLSCVIHCAIIRIFAERPAISLFLCGEHRAIVVSSAPSADLPVAPIPRALYELLSLPAAVIALAIALIAAVVAGPPRHPSSMTFAPPTPPPRPASA